MKYENTHPILNCPTFRYAAPWHQSQFMHDILVSEDHRVVVVGDPSLGAYEWVELRKTTHEPAWEAQENSDCGYGQSVIALRDALSTCLADE